MSSASNERVALVALGSNLGDSICALNDAIELLERFSTRPIVQSSFWRSTPLDCPPGSPDFINAAVLLTPFPQETPESLLTHLQELEKHFGRRPKKVLNEPRPMDLDLIAFGNEVRNSPALVLPHPRAHLRRFVLGPLTEIAPRFKLPGQQKTICELLRDLPVSADNQALRMAP
jgi:2-amino-4-hydroxy-6-hydroxymethyldihydropteridine diphosphokinase